MIFISNSEGTIVKVAPSSIQQGTNEGNEIILFAPFVGNVELLCILPNGMRADPIPMTPLFELEETELDGLPDSFKSNYIGKSVWRVLIPYAVTEYPGVLQVQFKITIPNGEVGEGENISRGIKTSTSNVYINPGYYTEEENPQETDNTAIANAAATAAKGYREGAEAWAVGTINSNPQAAPSEDNATYKTTAHAQNNAKYYADKAKKWTIGETDDGATPSDTNNAQHYAEQAGQSANTAEAWAVGEKDGTPVDSHAQNNAMYYAGKAGDALSKITPMHKCIKKRHEDIDAWHEDIDAWHEDIVTKHEEIKTWHGETETNARDAAYYANYAKEIFDAAKKIMDFRGPVDSVPNIIKEDGDNTYEDDKGILYKNGDVIVVTEGEYAEIEFVLWEGEWVELGDTSAAHEAIVELQTQIRTVNDNINKHFPRTYQSFSLPDSNSQGWYRIASVTKGGGIPSSAIFKVTASVQSGGLWSEIIFIASRAFMAEGNILVLNHQMSHNGKAIDNIRIGYETTAQNSPAYVDVHCVKNSSSATDTVRISVELLENVDTTNAIGSKWALLTPEKESDTEPYKYARVETVDDIFGITKIVESNAKKLDMVTNDEGLNKVYVAQKDGTQKMYGIESSASKGGTGVWRDENRYAQIKTPKDATGDYIINADYLNKKLEDVSANVEAISEQELIDILG